MQLDNVNKKQTLIDLDALCVQAVLASNEVKKNQNLLVTKYFFNEVYFLLVPKYDFW
jgi:hypothetical protein